MRASFLNCNRNVFHGGRAEPVLGYTVYRDSFIFHLLRPGSFIAALLCSSCALWGRTLGPSDVAASSAFGFLLLRLCFREGQGWLWWEGGLGSPRVGSNPTNPQANWPILSPPHPSCSEQRLEGALDSKACCGLYCTPESYTPENT